MHTKLVLVIPALVGILLTSVLACNNADPEAVLAWAQVELDKHRTLWEQTGSPDYTYEYYLGCLCLASTGQTLKVTVTNGEVESATYAGSGMMGKPGDTPVFQGPPIYHTIDSLFHLVQRAITNEAERITVSYSSAVPCSKRSGASPQPPTSATSAYGKAGETSTSASTRPVLV